MSEPARTAGPEAAREAALLRLAQAVRATGYAFVTPTPSTIARVNARPGAAWAEDLRGVFGWSRPFRDGVVAPDLLALMRAAGVLGQHPGGARSLVRLSSLHGELFLHSAYPTIDTGAVFFGPDTYRFADAVLAHVAQAGTAQAGTAQAGTAQAGTAQAGTAQAGTTQAGTTQAGATQAGATLPPRRTVDIGCGAGPAAILLARAYCDAGRSAAPGPEVIGVDINDAALRMTRVNAALAGVAVHAIRSDLLSGLDGGFDLIVANPPYLVDPGRRAYRHGGGPLGAGLSGAILDAALARLNPAGSLLLYTGAAVVDGIDAFHEAVRERLAGADVAWTYREIDPDVFGEELEGGPYVSADRIAAVLLTVTKGVSDHA